MMQTQQSPLSRTAMVAILSVVYAVLLVTLMLMARREADLVPQVAAAESAVAQMMSTKGTELQTVRSNLAAAQERLRSLEARLPTDIPADLFNRVAQDAQRSGISDFRYQRKGEYMENLQAGAYRVYRFSIHGSGSQDRLLTFLDALQQNAGATSILENVTFTAAGAEWQISADIVVYTWAG